MATRGQKLLAASTTVLIAEPLLQVAHQGGFGAVVGLGLGLIAYHAVDDLEKVAGKEVASLSARLPRRPKRDRSDPNNLPGWYRALNGKTTRNNPETDKNASTEELEDTEDIDTIIQNMREVRSEDGLPPVFGFLEEDEMLILGTALETSQRFDPHMDYILGRGVLLAGSQGTGKSNIIALIAYSAGRCQMPSLIIDFKGEFYPLCGVVPNGLLVGHPASVQESGKIPFFGLTVDTAEALAKRIMEEPCQVVLDVPSYEGDCDEVAVCVAALLHAMMNWGKAIRRKGQEPWPALIIVDEAHNYVPERRNLSAFAMKQPQESFAALTSAFSAVANAGRSFGYTLVMATQRLPNIAKWSIANLQVKAILAHSLKNDLDACEEETGGLIDREDIKALAQGTGIVMGLCTEPVVVAFDKQPAQHISNTPKVGRIRERFSASASTSPSDGVSTSASTSTRTEVATSINPTTEVGRSGSPGGTNWNRTGEPLRSLTEREKQIGEMFFNQGLGVTAIRKKIYPNINGGDASIKAADEINNAIRKYALYTDLTKERDD